MEVTDCLGLMKMFVFCMAIPKLLFLGIDENYETLSIHVQGSSESIVFLKNIFDFFQFAMLSQDHKMALALAIREKKHILIGKLNPGITMKVRASAWLQIMGRLNALGAHIENVDDIRNTDWDAMKKVAKKHFLVIHQCAP